MPTDLAALLIVLYAAAPDYAYLRCIERRYPRDTSTPLREIIEIFGAGFLSTAVVALAMLAAGQVSSAFLPLRGFISGASYLRNHPWQLILSAGILLFASIAVAGVAGILVGHRERRVVRGGNVWTVLLTRPRDGLRPYIAVELASGRLVEGYLLAASDHVDSDQRELVLQAPLADSVPGQPRVRSEAAYVIVKGSEIRMISAAFPVPRPRDGGTVPQATESVAGPARGPGKGAVPGLGETAAQARP